MFRNNINGHKNKIKIIQNNNKNVANNDAIKNIMIGLVVTVIGGIILYFIIGG